MGSKTATTTKNRALARKSVKKALDAADTLQAQVVRMRYGVGEEPDYGEVGQPAVGLDEQTRRRLLQIEEEVIGKAQSACRRQGVRNKIVRALKNK
jgi:hypothetical protein